MLPLYFSSLFTLHFSLFTLMIELDVHTHTVMSGHAFSSLTEMVQEAQKKDLKVYGITEHAPNIPGTCKPIYFWNYHVVPRQYGDMRLLLGAELNIMDTKGTLDEDDDYYKRLDIRIAGIHRLCWKKGTKEENTEGLVNAIRNPWTDIISHPGDGTADVFFEPIVLAAKETGTLLEINNSSMNPNRTNGQRHIQTISRYCNYARSMKCQSYLVAMLIYIMILPTIHIFILCFRRQAFQRI